MKSNDEKQTPLHFAARFGSSDVITCLINDYEANREAKDYFDRTPLYIAAEYGTKLLYYSKFYFLMIYVFVARNSNVKTLIDLGCCISYTDESKETTLNSKTGQTALYWIIMNTPENVRYFIDIEMQ